MVKLLVLINIMTIMQLYQITKLVEVINKSLARLLMCKFK